MNTSKLVWLIANAHGKNIRLTRFGVWSISLGFGVSKTIRKVFGSFVYDNRMQGSPGTEINGQRIYYETVCFEESVRLSEYR